jgi:tRNA(adenine34) deaminase
MRCARRLERFAALGDYAFAPHHVQDLPGLHGWRLHYVDEEGAPGEDGHLASCLCLHGPGEWGYFFRHLVGAQGLRTLVPDLIGFGKSDKPKREAAHRLEWHRDVLLEWLDRVQPQPVVLVHSAAATGLASLLQAAAADRFAAAIVAPDGGERIEDAWRAPYPDRGYEAALRALGPDRFVIGSDASAGHGACPVGTQRNGILGLVTKHIYIYSPSSACATRPPSGAA